MLTTQKPCRNKIIKIRRERDGGWLYTPEPAADHSVYEKLNQVATRILELCDGYHTEQQIADILIKESNGSPEIIAHDVEEFLQKLQKINYIEYNKTISPLQMLYDPWETPKVERALEAPLLTTIYVTNRCNMKCLHCCNADTTGRNTLKELSLDEWKRVIHELSEMSVFRICITGGEPLCHENIIEIIRFISEHSISTELNTNGLLLTADVAKNLKDAGLRTVNISLDGASSESHEKFRNMKGSFLRTIEAIKNCRNHGLVVSLTFTVNSINYKEIPQFFTLSKELGIDYIKFFFLMNYGRSKLNSWIFPTSDQLRIAYDLIASESAKKGEKFKDSIISESFFSQKNEPCPAGKSRYAITADGYVTPCVLCPSIDIVHDGRIIKPDNIRMKSMSEIWQKSEYLELVRNPCNLNNPCASCKQKDFCQGGCHAFAIAHFGSPFFGDPNCPIIRNMQKI